MSTLQDYLDQIKQEKSTKVLPENIKRDVTVFGITGEFGRGSDGIATKYESIEEMQLDASSKKDGDLGIVYNNSLIGITSTSKFQIATFPKTVTLNSVLEDTVNMGFMSLSGSYESSGSGTINSTSFSFTFYVDDYAVSGGDYRYYVNYTSSDGLTYTRTTFSSTREGSIDGDKMDFGMIIKFGSAWDEPEWNDVIGEFFKLDNISYEGIFECNSGSFEIAETQLNAQPENVYGIKTFLGNNLTQQGTLHVNQNLSLEQLKTRVNLYTNLGDFTLDNKVTNINNLFERKYNYKEFPTVNMSNVSNMSNVFFLCNNLSQSALSNIANSMPMPSQIHNSLIYYTGLFPNRFDENIRSLLFNKGYLDCDNDENFLTPVNFTVETNVRTNIINNSSRYGTEMANFLNSSIYYNKPNYINVTQDYANNNKAYVFLMENWFSEWSYWSPINVQSITVDINTENVISTFNMFADRTCMKNLNLINFNADKVTNATNMFKNCYNIKDLSNLEFNNLVFASEMFNGCSNLTNIPEISDTNLIEAYGMFNRCSNLIEIPNINISNLSNTSGMFASCKKMNFNNLTFNIGKSIDASSMFYFCGNLRKVSNVDVSSSKNSCAMFSSCYNLTDVDGLNLANSEDIGQLFAFCNNLVNVSNVYAPNATNMYEIFSGCKNLTSLRNLDTSNLIDAREIFAGCVNLVVFPESLNLSKCTTAYGLFSNCNNLTTEALPNFDLSNVKDVGYMFGNCVNLISVPNYDTSKCESFNGLFFGCKNMKEFPNLNTSNGSNFGATFNGCSNLTNFPQIDMSNGKYLWGTFRYCVNLTTVPDLNLPKATTISELFTCCSKLTSISSLDIPNVNSSMNCFSSCTSLVNAPIILNTGRLQNIANMFAFCYNLVNVPQYITSNVDNMYRMFMNCNNLSDASVQNIINMCLNSNIKNSTMKNLSNANGYSPFYNSNITNARYQNRLDELTAAGWTY